MQQRVNIQALFSKRRYIKQIAANVFGAYKGSTKKDQLRYSYNSVFPNLRNGFNNFSIDRRIKLTRKLHQCAQLSEKNLIKLSNIK